MKKHGDGKELTDQILTERATLVGPVVSMVLNDVERKWLKLLGCYCSISYILLAEESCVGIH